MIAKITNGSRVGDIAGYLHGPGRANEHQYLRAGKKVSGGVVIGGNLGYEGASEPGQWVKTMRAALNKRAEAKKPVWQCSLRNTANDRVLTDAEWADAGQDFAEAMGFENHPWVMVRHGEDHVHLVVSRVDFEGQLWSRSHDRRKAQKAASALEDTYGLEKAPRTAQKGVQRLTATEVHQQAKDREKMLTGHRQRHSEPAAEPGAGVSSGEVSAEEIAELRRVTGQDFPTAPRPGLKHPEMITEAEHRARQRRQDRDRGGHGLER